jgi:hypothetical protein
MHIKDKIELLNRAFPMAWYQITPPKDPTLSWNLSERLAEIIKAFINAGVDDAQAIADAAATSVQSRK